MASLIAKDNGTLKTGWDVRHNAAITYQGRTNELESGIVSMLTGWDRYARAHKARFDSPIGEHYVLGPAWLDIGRGLLTLLNGEMGRLDGGTCDSFIRATATENGMDIEA